MLVPREGKYWKLKCSLARTLCLESFMICKNPSLHTHTKNPHNSKTNKHTPCSLNCYIFAYSQFFLIFLTSSTVSFLNNPLSLHIWVFWLVSVVIGVTSLSIPYCHKQTILLRLFSLATTCFPFLFNPGFLVSSLVLCIRCLFHELDLPLACQYMISLKHFWPAGKTHPEKRANPCCFLFTSFHVLPIFSRYQSLLNHERSM